MYCSRKWAMILGSIVWGRKNFTFVYIKHDLSQTGASLVGRDLCANYLDVILFTLCLLSSSRQFVSLREAFMELSENMCTAVEMVPSVNSANFKLSSRESDNWICTQTHKQTYLNLVSHVLITLSSTTNWVYHVTSLFGLYRTSVMESNLKFSFRVFFSLPVFWPSTTAAVTTVFPTTQ